MKTILIPVDFDAVSKNTMDYAVEWSKAYNYDKIILLKTLYGSMFDTLIASADYMHVHQDYLSKEREESEYKLTAINAELSAKAGEDIKVVSLISELPLLRAILETIEEERPELIITGSDNFGSRDKNFITQSVISIAKISPVKVLIVPNGYQYETIEQILVPCDFEKIDTLSKLENYYTTASKLEEKKLLVINIDPRETYLYPTQELKDKERLLHNYLKDFPHEIFYSNNKDVIKGITAFAKEHDVQLIVSLPGAHSFFYTLTHKSISHAIYNNATKPVLILK